MARCCQRQGGKPLTDYSVRQGQANTATPYFGKGKRYISSEMPRIRGLAGRCFAALAFH